MRPLYGDSDSIKNLQHKTELLPWSQEPTPQSESVGQDNYPWLKNNPYSAKSQLNSQESSQKPSPLSLDSA